MITVRKTDLWGMYATLFIVGFIVGQETILSKVHKFFAVEVERDTEHG